MAKRAREQAVKERRERKREKKAERAAAKLLGPDETVDGTAASESDDPDSEQSASA
jgi:Zn-dependent peptidase ImmA (M78 family)